MQPRVQGSTVDSRLQLLILLGFVSDLPSLQISDYLNELLSIAPNIQAKNNSKFPEGPDKSLLSKKCILQVRSILVIRKGEASTTENENLGGHVHS